MRLPQLVWSALAQPNTFELSLCVHRLEIVHGILHWSFRIRAVLIVQIWSTAKACDGSGILSVNGLRRRIRTRHGDTKLRCDHKLLAAMFGDSLSYNGFAV